jgi:hypothetical protein
MKTNADGLHSEKTVTKKKKNMTVRREILCRLDVRRGSETINLHKFFIESYMSILEN